jgi:hypothetical protein
MYQFNTFFFSLLSPKILYNYINTFAILLSSPNDSITDIIIVCIYIILFPDDKIIITDFSEPCINSIIIHE